MTSAKISDFVSNIHSDTTVSKNQGTAGKSRDAVSTEADFAAVIGRTAVDTGKTEYSYQSSGRTGFPKETGRQFEVREKPFSKKDVSEIHDSTTFKDALKSTERAFERGVKDILKEKLGVTENEIEEAMSELGLSFLQLMNPADLSQLAAKLAGTDNTCELLLNDGFADVMQSVDALAKSLVSDFGGTKEELISLNSQLQELTAEGEELPEGQKSNENSGSNEAVTEVFTQSGEAADGIMSGRKMEDLRVEDVQTKPADGKNVQESELLVKVNEVIDEPIPEDAMQEENQNAAKHDARDDEASKDSGLFQNGQTAEFEAGSVRNQTAEVLQPAAYTRNIRVDEIMQQISDYARVHFTQDAASMEMQLNPENLGKLYIHVSTTKEGNVTAQIAASNEVVKEILQTQMADLKTTLNQQGVKVDAVEVTVASHGFEQNLEQNASGEQQQAQQEQINTQRARRLFRGELEELSGLMSEEEALAAQMMKDHGNTMDVTA